MIVQVRMVDSSVVQPGCLIVVQQSWRDAIQDTQWNWLPDGKSCDGGSLKFRKNGLSRADKHSSLKGQQSKVWKDSSWTVEEDATSSLPIVICTNLGEPGASYRLRMHSGLKVFDVIGSQARGCRQKPTGVPIGF